MVAGEGGACSLPEVGRVPQHPPAVARCPKTLGSGIDGLSGVTLECEAGVVRKSSGGWARLTTSCLSPLLACYHHVSVTTACLSPLLACDTLRSQEGC